MKMISVILSTYLLGLSFLPCADGAELLLLDVTDLIETEGTHDHKDDCGDHCSPLCFCSCCHITLRPPVAVGFQLRLPLELVAQTNVASFSLPDLLLTHEIWQPPK